MTPLSYTSFHDRYDLYIFDLDGTLYDQPTLRRIMLRKLFIRLVTGRMALSTLKIIREFRREREKHKGYASSDLDNEQYHWVSLKTGIGVDRVRDTIREYMEVAPLTELFRCRYPAVKDFFRTLRQNRKLIAVLSDYPVAAKLQALELDVDAMYCSTDPDIGQLKPSARGIDLIREKLGIAKENTIFIGDREDTDGKSARQAGVDFLKIDRDVAVRGILFNHLRQRIEDHHD